MASRKKKLEDELVPTEITKKDLDIIEDYKKDKKDGLKSVDELGGNEVLEKMDTVNEAVNMKLEDLDGIGPIKLKKLYGAGIYTIDELTQHGEESLVRMLDINWDEARKLVVIANESINTDDVFSSLLVSGREYADYRKKKIKFLTTGHEEFDEITDGYETGVITEFFGAFGSGKTQFTEVASIMAQLPKESCCLHCGQTTELEGDKCKVLKDPKDKKSECGGTLWGGGGLSKYGKPCRVIYIDTENSYRDDRVFNIVCNRELILTKPQSITDQKKDKKKEPLNEEEYEKAMEFVYNIDISRPRTTALQMLVVNNLGGMIDGDLCKKCHRRAITKEGKPTHQDSPLVKRDKDGVLKEEFKETLVKPLHNFEKDKPATIVVIDSLTGKFRKEFEGRGTLSDRQMKLKSHVKVLESIVESKNVVCLVTNQVGEKMDLMGSGDNIRPVGGNEIGHTFTHRIYLKKAQALNKDKVTAILVDSPNHAKNEVVLELGARGIQKPKE